MPRQSLGELEQVLLLALLRLGGDAYGAAIRAEILDRTGRSITPGANYLFSIGSKRAGSCGRASPVPPPSAAAARGGTSKSPRRVCVK